MLGRVIRGGLGRLGYSLHRRSEDATALFPPDLDEDGRRLFRRVQPYTLTSPERVAALRDSVRYISTAAIPGAICECGVWRGGSMMAVAITLVELGDTSRDLYLFDTFTRPPDTGPRDGPDAQANLERSLNLPHFAYLPQEVVRSNMEATGYPAERLHLIQGLVEDTIPCRAPSQIALLRLDTDYYSSTAHEMNHLYPRVGDGGVVIIDDYGEFVGARQAVDEYFKANKEVVLMNRIDATGRLIIVRRT